MVGNNVFGGDERLYIVSKLLTLVFFFVVLLRIIQKGKVRVNQILLLPVIFTVYCAATALWAYSPNHVINKMVTQTQLLLLLIFTFWAMNDSVTVLDYLKAVYVSGFGLAIFAIVRYGGLNEYMDVMLEGERMGGEITNQNTFGMAFGNAALSATYYFLIKKKRKHIVSFVLFALFAFSSGSRKAMLMIVAGIVFISVIHYGIRRMYRTLIIGTIVVIATIFALQLPYFSTLAKRIERTLSGDQSISDRGRESMIRFGLEMFKERPIFGFGIDNFRARYVTGQYSHNNYIELMVSGGLVALVMYYLMFLVPAVSLLLSKRKGENLPEMHLMLLVWLANELIFGWGMVQMYNKNSWLLAGVLMAESVHALGRGTALREDHDETVEKIEESLE